MENKGIKEQYDKIDKNIKTLISIKEVESGVFRTRCMKNSSHIAYYDNKNHKIFCPYCRYEMSLVELSSSILGVNDIEMLLSILLKKLNQKKNEVIDLIQEIKELNKKKEIYYEANEKALNIFKAELQKNKFAQDYIFKKRKMTKQIVDKFQIGFAPKNNLILKNLSKEYSSKELYEIGLLGYNDENKQYYDIFTNRIMFPVFNKANKIIAFGGRTLGNAKNKYLNTPTTLVFKKSYELYALNTLKKDKKYPYILCSEGYMDVIALHQEGICNVVANLGTAFTEHHLKILSKYTDKIILMLDGDDAGINAMKRSICKVGKICTLTLPDNLDPDEYIKKYSKIELLNYIEKNHKTWEESMCDVLLKETIDTNINVFEKLILLKDF